jgi:hypothetical protein
MKKVIVTMLMIFSSASALAQDKNIWTCDGSNVEGAGVSKSGDHLVGSVSWDCWPGGGICDAQATVTESYDKNGDLVYRGSQFWLIIHVSKAPTKNGYRAHLIATDKSDAPDMGRGLTFDEFFTCSQ